MTIIKMSEINESIIIKFDPTIELADNAMLRHRPDLFDQWDFEKNDLIGLDVYKVTKASGKKAWWTCKSCGHGHFRAVSNMAKNNSCPYCTGNGKNAILVGFNDMWTTNPELASQLLNPEDGYKFKQHSNVKVDWRCLSCKHEILRKQIANVNKCGLACQYCSDGKSFPERVMYRLLNELKLRFEWDRNTTWSEGKRYDFYIPEMGGIIIEVHGEQHYKKSFVTAGGRSLDEEIENDMYKEELAKLNGITHYIVIDASRATFDSIKESITNSMLNKLYSLEEIDWIKIHKKTVSPIIKDVCDLWNQSFGTAGDIGLELNLDRNAVTQYLKVGATFGICDYTPKKGKNLSDGKAKKPIVQLTLDGDFVSYWNSASDYVELNNLTSATGIRNCCTGARDSCYGYQWMERDAYEEIIKSEDSQERLKYIKKTNKKIVQLDLEDNLIREWSSMSEAAKELGGHVSNISSCCRKDGYHKSACGFKWMYVVDYYKEVN